MFHLRRCWPGVAVGFLLCLALGATLWRSTLLAPVTARSPAEIEDFDGAGESLPAFAWTAKTDTVQNLGWPCLFGPRGDSVADPGEATVAWGESGPRVLWRRPIGAGYAAPIVTDDGLVLFHRQGDQEILEAVDPRDGASRWRFSTPTNYKCKYRYSDGPYATPAISGEFVVAQGAEGRLNAVDRRTGTPRWQRWPQQELGVTEGLFGVGASPLLVGGRVYLNVGAGEKKAAAMALDLATGKTLWTAGEAHASYSTPRHAIIHGQPYLFVLFEEGLTAFDPENGVVRWQVPFRPTAVDTINAVTPVIERDLLLLVSGPGPGALCLRILPDGGYEQVWANRRTLDSQFNNLVLQDGYVYGFTSTFNNAAAFRCVELASGRLCWSKKSELRRGSALAIGPALFVLGEHGHLGVFRRNPSKIALECMTKDPLLASPCYSAPAFHRGLLYLRNEKELVCVDFRNQDPKDVTPSGASPAGKAGQLAAP